MKLPKVKDELTFDKNSGELVRKKDIPKNTGTAEDIYEILLNSARLSYRQMFAKAKKIDKSDGMLASSIRRLAYFEREWNRLYKVFHKYNIAVGGDDKGIAKRLLEFMDKRHKDLDIASYDEECYKLKIEELIKSLNSSRESEPKKELTFEEFEKQFSLKAHIPSLGITLDKIALYPDGNIGIDADYFTDILKNTKFKWDGDESVYSNDEDREVVLSVLCGDDWLWIEPSDYILKMDYYEMTDEEIQGYDIMNLRALATGKKERLEPDGFVNQLMHQGMEIYRNWVRNKITSK